jgi:hypothetical protein
MPIESVWRTVTFQNKIINLNRSPNFWFQPRNLNAAFNSPPILSGKSPWEDHKFFLHIILPRSVDSLRVPSSRCEISKICLSPLIWLTSEASGFKEQRSGVAASSESLDTLFGCKYLKFLPNSIFKKGGGRLEKICLFVMTHSS